MPTPTAPTVDVQALGRIKSYVCRILDASIGDTNFRLRLDQIDRDYARYQEASAQLAAGVDSAGQDVITLGNRRCGVDTRDVVNPVVISQVDSIVSYWAEVYLSGYPIFPVVSTPNNKSQAEALEGIVQDHMVLAESVPEMQLLLKDAGKYNAYAAEVDWAPMQTFKPYADIADFSGEAKPANEDTPFINYINRINLRNCHWDRRIPLSKMDLEGDFVGYSKIYTRMGLKKLLNQLGANGLLASKTAADMALKSNWISSDYYDDPIISNWGTDQRPGETNYDSYGGYIDPVPDGYRKVPESSTNTYAVHTFYLRIVPSDFVMRGIPNKNSVQVWKVRMVNRAAVISCEPYNGAMGRLGIFMGVALEDGLDLQTQSYAEMATPIQNATTRLFNARFHMTKRMIGDRAVYNSDLIRPSDVNNPSPSAKIPIKAGKLNEYPLSSAYMSIPFNTNGTESAIQDAILINDWAKELSGQNSATRGQFTKGNRTLGEFDSIMGASENRMRLGALVLEYRLFNKLKEQLKLNILQFGDNTQVISPRNGVPLQVNIEELKKQQLQFELADGYTPKSKKASTDFLTALMQMIMNSPILQQLYGQQLPGMIAHVAQLGGVRGFDQYAQAALTQYQGLMQFQKQLQALMQGLTDNGQITPEQQAAVEQAGAEGNGQQAPAGGGQI